MQTYIGLGSNLGECVKILESAFTHISQIPDTQLVSSSSFYASKPLAGMQQNDYVNAVALLLTSLSAIKLLDVLQSIENRHGRTRSGQYWESRTLDLDILLYHNEQINSKRLIVPHYAIAQRDFVLLPLQEINPELDIVGYGHIKKLVSACPMREIKKLDL